MPVITKKQMIASGEKEKDKIRSSIVKKIDSALGKILAKGNFEKGEEVEVDITDQEHSFLVSPNEFSTIKKPYCEAGWSVNFDQDVGIVLS